MNCLIFAYGLACLVLAVNGGADTDHMTVRQKCYGEIGLEKDGLSASTFLQNPKSGCYLKCFLENLNLYKADGSIDAVHAVELIQEDIQEQARPLINKCVDEAANVAERCEKSLAAFKCLFEANAQIFEQLDVIDSPKAA